MTKRDNRTPEEREADERLDRANAREARLDETLTRREVVEALRTISNDRTNGPPEAQRIADAFKQLAKALI